MKFNSLTLAAAALLASGSAFAVDTTYTGATTLTGPTFNRPLASSGPPTGLSAVGTAVHYSAFTFTVTATGSYSFLSTAATGFDNFIVLYAGTFNPASPLMSGLLANDDFPSVGMSGFSAATLTAGSSYVMVTTGFSNTDVGSFSNTFTGPGSVTAVPEPASYALMALGLVGVGLAARRRTSTAKDVAVA